MKEGKAVKQSKKDVKGEEQRHQAMAEKKQEGDAERRKAGKEEACRRAKAAEAEAARRAEDEVLASLLPALSPALVRSSTSGAGAVTGAELDKAQQERAPSPAASAGVAPPSETGASLASGHGRAKAMNRSANQEVQGVAAEALLQGRFFDYQTLHEATRGFAKRLGSGGFGSVFEGTLACGTQVAVKKLEIQAAGSSREDLMQQMRQEVATLSKIHHANIVPLMGACQDPSSPSSSSAAAAANTSPCLVYALMEGGSLEDRLARPSLGSGSPLTAAERILILSDVARGLAYLHSELKVAHLDVKSGNVLLDRGLVGRIGDFGVCKAIKDTSGATATHLHTENVAGTLVYMAPEYKNGQASVKVDTFAFGLVVIEALTGRPVLNPAPGYENLLLMFEDEMTEPNALAAHLDSTTSWDQAGTLERVESLRKIADRCLEARRARRPELLHIIPEMEEVRSAAQAMAAGAQREGDRAGRLELECTVCLEDVTTRVGPIFQCPEGHLYCTGCHAGLGGAKALCGSCGSLLGSVRNRALEQMRV